MIYSDLFQLYWITEQILVNKLDTAIFVYSFSTINKNKQICLHQLVNNLCYFGG